MCVHLTVKRLKSSMRIADLPCDEAFGDRYSCATFAARCGFSFPDQAPQSAVETIIRDTQVER